MGTNGDLSGTNVSIYKLSEVRPNFSSFRTFSLKKTWSPFPPEFYLKSETKIESDLRLVYLYELEIHVYISVYRYSSYCLGKTANYSNKSREQSL